MTVSKELKKLNLASGKKTLEVFDKAFPKILKEKYTSEAAFVNGGVKTYQTAA